MVLRELDWYVFELLVILRVKGVVGYLVLEKKSIDYVLMEKI